MIIALIISILVTWISSMGLVMSALTLNTAGMFGYGMVLMISGSLTRFFLDQL